MSLSLGTSDQVRPSFIVFCFLLPILIHFVSLLSAGHRIVLCVLYCTVLYCTVLYCTVLYCTVDSWPAPASFSWGFNNSKDAVKLGRELYSVAGHQVQQTTFIY